MSESHAAKHAAQREEPKRIASDGQETERTAEEEDGDEVEAMARSLAGDLRRLEAEARRLVGAADDIVRGQVADAPLLCVGLAFGAGVVLGGGISRRTASALIALGGRAALEQLRSTHFASGGGTGFAAGGGSEPGAQARDGRGEDDRAEGTT